MKRKLCISEEYGLLGCKTHYWATRSDVSEGQSVPNLSSKISQARSSSKQACLSKGKNRSKPNKKPAQAGGKLSSQSALLDSCLDYPSPLKWRWYTSPKRQALSELRGVTAQNAGNLNSSSVSMIAETKYQYISATTNKFVYEIRTLTLYQSLFSIQSPISERIYNSRIVKSFGFLVITLWENHY